MYVQYCSLSLNAQIVIQDLYGHLECRANAFVNNEFLS